MLHLTAILCMHFIQYLGNDPSTKKSMTSKHFNSYFEILSTLPTLTAKFQPRSQSNFKKIAVFRLPLIAKRCAGDEVEIFL